MESSAYPTSSTTVKPRRLLVARLWEGNRQVFAFLQVGPGAAEIGPHVTKIDSTPEHEI